MTIPAKEYIKKLTTIPEAFVDELFEFYGTDTMQTDFVIKLDAVGKWLNADKRSIVRTLKHTYTLNIDYIISREPPAIKKSPHANNYKTYLLTPDCFKRLAMMSRGKNAEMVRSYFIEIESLFIKYREQLLEGMQQDIERLERNQKPKGNFDPKPGYLYIIRASENNDSMYKIGRTTKSMIERLRQYNVGKADDIEVLYTYHANDVVAAEACLKAYLKKHQYRKRKEVYEAELPVIKRFLKSCADIGAKLVQKQGKSVMKGGHYIVVDSGL